MSNEWLKEQDDFYTYKENAVLGDIESRFLMLLWRITTPHGLRSFKFERLQEVADGFHCPKSNLYRAIAHLVELKIINKLSVNTYEVNTNFEEWVGIASERISDYMNLAFKLNGISIGIRKFNKKTKLSKFIRKSYKPDVVSQEITHSQEVLSIGDNDLSSQEITHSPVKRSDDSLLQDRISSTSISETTTREESGRGSSLNDQIRILQKAILDKYDNTRVTTYPACRSIIQKHLDKGGLQYVLERLDVMPLALDSHSLPINALQRYCDNPDWVNGNTPSPLLSQREKDFKDGKFQWGLARDSTDKGARLTILRSLKKRYVEYGKDFADYIGVPLDSFTICLQEAESDVYGEGADRAVKTLDILNKRSNHTDTREGK